MQIGKQFNKKCESILFEAGEFTSMEPSADFSVDKINKKQQPGRAKCKLRVTAEIQRACWAIIRLRVPVFYHYPKIGMNPRSWPIQPRE